MSNSNLVPGPNPIWYFLSFSIYERASFKVIAKGNTIRVTSESLSQMVDNILLESGKSADKYQVIIDTLTVLNEYEARQLMLGVEPNI